MNLLKIKSFTGEKLLSNRVYVTLDIHYNGIFNGSLRMSFKAIVKKELYRICGFSVFLKAASLFKISYVIGSYSAFFSATNIVMPAVGLCGGSVTAWFVFCIGCLLRIILGHGTIVLLAVNHIPGFFAALYCVNRGFFIRFLVPVICFLLFVLHPIGRQAFPYAFYWVIPMFLYFMRQRSIFLTALGSTLVAHAIGSVLWLYFVPMDAALWWGLIPIVAIERLLFALGVVFVHHMITCCVPTMRDYVCGVFKKKFVIEDLG